MEWHAARLAGVAPAAAAAAADEPLRMATLRISSRYELPGALGDATRSSTSLRFASPMQLAPAGEGLQRRTTWKLVRAGAETLRATSTPVSVAR